MASTTSWSIAFTPRAQKDLKRIATQDANRIVRSLERIAESDPRSSGKALKGQLKEFWRWRVGDYRILGRIEDGRLLVLVVRVGHRRDVYVAKP